MNLFALWDLSLGLAALSLAIMVGLIVARIRAERRRRRFAADRSRLMPLLLDFRSKGEALLDPLVPKPLLADLAVDLMRLVRGDDRNQFVAAVTRAGVDGELRKRLARGSARNRASAAEALAFFPDARSTDALEKALDDRSGDVRFAAALALARSDRAPHVSALIDRLGLGTREQSMLIVTLFQLIAAVRLEEIRNLIEADRVAPSVQAAAIEALASTGDFSLVPMINALALKTEQSSDTLPRIIRALGAFHHPAGAPAIRRSLSSPSAFVRAAGAEAAGRIALIDAAPALSELLFDKDWWVRFRSGEALARLGPRGEALLRETACMGAEPARSAARLTLAEQGLKA